MRLGNRDASQRALVGVFNLSLRQGPIGNAVDQAKLLLHRQSDDPSQRDALLLQIVLRLNQHGLLGLQLHPCAQGVDIRHQSCRLLIHRQLVQRLRCFQFSLGCSHTGLVGDGEQIIRPYGQHHRIPSVS